MFKENPLFDDEDLLQLENNQNEEVFSDDELNGLINQSISDINNIKDLRQTFNTNTVKLDNNNEAVSGVLKKEEISLISKSKTLPPLKIKKK